MTKLAIKGVLAIAVMALAACTTIQDNMPSWMPGSGAAKVKLSGTQEVPAASSSGSGSGSFKLDSDGTISGSVTTEGVQGTMAHIHQADKGKNGPVIVPLTKEGDTYSVPEGRKLTDAQIQAFKAGNLYVNVHSSRYKGGEVRAQIEP